MQGLDDIGITLVHEAAITAFEATRPAWMPSHRPDPPSLTRARPGPGVLSERRLGRSCGRAGTGAG